MRYIALIAVLATTACATLTAEGDQPIQVVTTPTGASCTISNAQGSWYIAKTPGSALVKRDFSPLKIACSTKTLTGSTVLEPLTRDRAYGNILLLGVPAVVDAATGYGYEYSQDAVTISLKK